MKTFSCGDVVAGCTRTFRGSEEDILAAVGAHARADHGLTSLPPELISQVRRHIVAVP